MRSTRSADRILGRRLLHHLFPELARRSVAERLVRVKRLVRVSSIIVLEPVVEPAQDACGIGLRVDLRLSRLINLTKASAIPFDCGLSRHQADVARKGTCFPRSIGRAVV
jgi:hypothetical protein